MTYQEMLEKARENMSGLCKACPVCNGKACGNHIPSRGEKHLQLEKYFLRVSVDKTRSPYRIEKRFMHREVIQ